MSTPTTQESPPIVPRSSIDDLLLIKLAREIAMAIRPTQDILTQHGVTNAAWSDIQANHRFQQYLRQSLEEWESATNTGERVRLKSLAIVEEVLPEFYARMHDMRETLSAKTEVLKSIAKFGGVGAGPDIGADLGNRMTVTINLGADQRVTFDKEVTPRGNPVLNYDLDAEIAEEFSAVAGDSAEEIFEEGGETAIDWNWDEEDRL